MSKYKYHIVGLLSGLSWAISTIGLYTVLNLYGGAVGDASSTLGWVNLVLTALIIASADTIINIATEILVLLRLGYFKEMIQLIKSGKSIRILPASILAGVFGLVPYSVASSIDTSLSGSISSLYPVVGAVLSGVLLGQSLRKSQWLGVVVSTIGMVFLNGKLDPSSVDYLALILALVTAFGWGSEAVFGYKMMESDVNPIVTITLRHIYSLILFVIMILALLPIAGDWSYPLTLISNFGNNLGLPKYATILILIASSSIGAISYILWYVSMKHIKVAVAMTLNITYGLWIVLITWASGLLEVSSSVVITSILIFLGALLVIRGEKVNE